MSYTKDTLKKYEVKSDKVIVVAGGSTRNDTIMNGIRYIEENIGLNDDDIIITHDAVRPFFNTENY